jgi:hypothetical protein
LESDWCSCMLECGEIEYKTEHQLMIFDKYFF